MTVDGPGGRRWRREFDGRPMSPGGRPLDYRGSDGWGYRILSKSLAAGGFGAGAGLLVGAVRGQPALRLGLSVGTNFLIAASCFGAAQEISRELRAAEPENLIDAAVGGFASGALLGHFHGGRARTLPMGILFAVVGTGLQLGAAEYKEYRIRHFLNTLPSEPLIADANVEVPVVKEEETTEESSWKLPDWFPIQMLSAEQAAKRAAEQEKKRQKTVENLQIGELPLKQQKS
ncbi:uncharacterized protein [Physcomitrium patens]|uniref:Uncharacterized protein n=1 Tax=Physcomitrium patens TaxID=3218 RepID=A0A2K1INF3_PHYPA|nr:uncharacterized protein LOC112274679 [Physcomitrium patens]PNR30800.1 hypothetical protein PHYPA_027116 [Physcomitrium patens]|eukprot:XP_024360113.1 uncharacterized protein LOC112274679 [Physcomitrella patens]